MATSQISCTAPSGSEGKFRCGFTLVEILLALAVTVIMVSALAAALIGALHAEQTTDRLMEGRLILQEQAALRTVALPEKDVPEPLAGWRIISNEVTRGEGDEETRWAVIEAVPDDPPSPRLAEAFPIQ